MGNGDRSKPQTLALHHGDNLDVLTRLAADADVAGRVDLVYLDPPFGTGRDFGAFDDRFTGGIDGLVSMLRPRFVALRALLAADGSILVHVDPRAAPRIACALDEIFGAGDREPSDGRRPGFRNELVWVYGLGGSSPRFWPRKHDTILWYTKGSDWYFDPPMVPARSQRMRGKLKKQLDVMFGPPALEAAGTREMGEALAMLGMTDVLDVPNINNRAAERLGYPTQKPLELLTLLVRAHAREGGLVLDPFCGSGTTLAAARASGRRAIGIDVGADAIEVCEKRLGISARR